MGVSQAKFQLSIANDSGAIARKPSGVGTPSAGEGQPAPCRGGVFTAPLDFSRISKNSGAQRRRFFDIPVYTSFPHML